jgi:hypothetical protein
VKIIGAEYLRRVVPSGTFTAKMVFNDQGAHVFSAQYQHRTMKTSGISYEHDGKGNALAAMLKQGLIEIRHDARFNDDRVVGIIRKLLACPELALMKGWKVTYQGRTMSV